MTKQNAKELLLSGGFDSADAMPAEAFGQFEARNREITQAVIFDGATLESAGDRFGLSRERARQVAVVATRRTLGV